MKLDPLDWQLLAELDADASQSLETMAKKTSTSKDVVNYRIGRLEKSSIIVRYDTLIDYSKAGYLLCGASLKFKNEVPIERQHLSDYLVAEPLIRTICWRTGEYDLDAEWYARSVPGFLETKKTLMGQHPGCIKKFNSEAIGRLYLYPRGYLSEKPGPSHTIFMEYEPKKQTDRTDDYILSMIAKRAWLPLGEIAKELAISTAQAHRRIKRMEEKRITLGSRAVLDVEKLGYARFKLQLYLDDFKIHGDILSHIASLPNAISASEALGRADLEVDIETNTYEDFKKIEAEIKQKFGKAIYYTKDYAISRNVLQNL